MLEKKYHWLKQYSDFFSKPEIKKLRKIAGGDTYTIIYQKLMLISLKGEGVIYLQGIEPTIEEELALILDEQVEDLRVVIAYLKSLNLVEMINDRSLLLPSVIPLIGSETSAAERMRRHRMNKICNDIPTTICNNVTVERNIVTPMLHSVTPMLHSVTQSKRESKRRDRDREKEIYKEKNDKPVDKSVDNLFKSNDFNDFGVSKVNKSTNHKKIKISEEDIQEIFNHWVTVTGKDGHRTRLDSTRRRFIVKAISTYGYEKKNVLKAISGVLNSSYHLGDNPEGKKYMELSLILRDAAHIEQFMDYFDSLPINNNKRGEYELSKSKQERSGEAFNRVGSRLFKNLIESRGAEDGDNADKTTRIADENVGVIP